MYSQLRRGATVAALVVVVMSGGVQAGDFGIGEEPAEPGITERPADPGVEWVVGGSAMSRGAGGETYSVTCVHADQFELDPAEWTHEREVLTDKATSYNAVDGTRCPDGPILGEW